MVLETPGIPSLVRLIFFFQNLFPKLPQLNDRIRVLDGQLPDPSTRQFVDGLHDVYDPHEFQLGQVRVLQFYKSVLIVNYILKTYDSFGSPFAACFA